MTVNTTSNRVSYAGGSGATQYPFSFKIFMDTDLAVIDRDADGAESDWILNTDYTVTGAGNDSGGNVVAVTPPDSGHTLVILRQVPLTQLTDYQEGDAFPAETHEDALDKLTMIAQQIDEELGRSVTLPRSSPSSNIEIPEPNPGRLLGWNSTGSNLENYSSLSSETLVSAFGESLIDDADAAEARTTLGLDSMALQAAGAVSITGGTIDGAVIGGSTPAAGTFGALGASSASLGSANISGLNASKVAGTDGDKNLVSDPTPWTAEHSTDGVHAHQALNPVGSIIAFAGDAPPNGYLECDGSEVSRTTYAALFAVISEMCGNGDGSTTFNLPDLRGRFLRGWDHGAGVDPDAAGRTDRGDGTSGDAVLTKQAEDLKNHRHLTLLDSGGFLGGPGGSNLTTSGSSQYTGYYGGTETRPTNVNVLWAVKY